MSRPLLPDRFSALDDPRQRSKVVSTPPGTMLSVLCAMPAGSIAPALRCICRTPVPPPGGCRPSAPRGAGTMVKPSRADGGNAESFRLAPGGAKALPPIQWQGPSPLPQHHADPTPTGGPKPPASARPAPGGRWPAFFPDLPVCGAPLCTGGRNAGRVSCSRPKGQSLCPDRAESPGRQAVGMVFRHPAPSARPR
jgi:hypothetical protein